MSAVGSNLVGSRRSRSLEALAGLSATAWAYLLLGRGGYWRAQPILAPASSPDPGATVGSCDTAVGSCDTAVSSYNPVVVAIVPARNEAELLPGTLSLLARQGPCGLVGIVVVDDASTDKTATVAETTDTGAIPVFVVRSAPLPDGWTGKVWALEQGRRAALARWGTGASEQRPTADEQRATADRQCPGADDQPPGSLWLWLVDADIAVRDGVLERLLVEARKGDRDLVSVMAKLRVEHPAERLLVPAFVYFFQLLYPFRWVGRAGSRTAAAAGGCVLVRSEALERLGGFGTIAGQRIDDVALARAIRRDGRAGGPRPGRLWLGFDDGVESRRPYDGLRPLWDMVARNAFTQLGESWALLAVTVAGLGLTFVAPPVLASARCIAPLRAAWPGGRGRRRGALVGEPAGWVLAGPSRTVWATAAATSAAAVLSYLPTVRRCGLPRRWALTLPLASILYAGMTVDSARRSRAGLSWRGRRLGGGRPPR
jgi:hypothetical protein